MATIVGSMLFSVLGNGNAQAFQGGVKGIAAERTGAKVGKVTEKG